MLTTKKNGRGRQDRLLLPPLFPSFEKDGKHKSPHPQPSGLVYITSERLKRFWNIRPRLKSTKNWSSDSLRSNRLHFEWKASGLTDVCFWTAPKPSGLADQVRFNFG